MIPITVLYSIYLKQTFCDLSLVRPLKSSGHLYSVSLSRKDTSNWESDKIKICLNDKIKIYLRSSILLENRMDSERTLIWSNYQSINADKAILIINDLNENGQN